MKTLFRILFGIWLASGAVIDGYLAYQHYFVGEFKLFEPLPFLEQSLGWIALLIVPMFFWYLIAWIIIIVGGFMLAVLVISYGLGYFFGGIVFLFTGNFEFPVSMFDIFGFFEK